MTRPWRRHLFRVFWARRVKRLGYVAVRQAMLRRGGDMQDVAWVLVTTLMIQGA